MANVGDTLQNHNSNSTAYLNTGDPGDKGGGFYTGTDSQPTLDQYESIFGPAGRDVKQDPQRHKRHQRWHLPDALKGYNQYLTDRIDGLITDATNSPFTRNILPYKYLENPDQKIKWNVYSFDEGIASRVPYESAARVLPQTKRSYAGFTVRHGLAIAMEHNFMVSAAGRENFKNQLQQLVGSIQLTNDLDVHVALLQATSYQRQMSEKYYDQTRTISQACRQYTDLFGMLQKTTNALDFLIEDAKNHLKTWGSQPPTFMLCNGKLTTQLTMNPEKTNYLTNGPDGKALLAQGPDLPSYRGVSIIQNRKFSLDQGTAPRDLLRRKVRVAEYYRIPYENTEHFTDRTYELYDQSRDTMFRMSWWQIYEASVIPEDASLPAPDVNLEATIMYKPGNENNDAGDTQRRKVNRFTQEQKRRLIGHWNNESNHGPDLVILRPNIEHEMMGIILGRGGDQELGCTFWGQTELSCYDDAQHGIWGMSYKYHERAMVTNEKNLIRLYDVSFDGYNGGMDQTYVNWTANEESSNSPQSFARRTFERTVPYNGPSMICMSFIHDHELACPKWPNPIIFAASQDASAGTPDDAGTINNIQEHDIFGFTTNQMPNTTYVSTEQRNRNDQYLQLLGVDDWPSLRSTAKTPGDGCISSECDSQIYAFEGTIKCYNGSGALIAENVGTGFLGPSYVGVATVREGRGIQTPTGPVQMGRLI